MGTTMNIYTYVAPDLQRDAADRHPYAGWPNDRVAVVSKSVSNGPIDAEIPSN